MSNIQGINNIPEIQSPFEQLRELDADGRVLLVSTFVQFNYHLKQIDESGEIHLSDTIRKIRIPSDKSSGDNIHRLD